MCHAKIKYVTTSAIRHAQNVHVVFNDIPNCDSNSNLIQDYKI